MLKHIGTICIWMMLILFSIFVFFGLPKALDFYVLEKGFPVTKTAIIFASLVMISGWLVYCLVFIVDFFEAALTKAACRDELYGAKVFQQKNKDRSLLSYIL